MYGNLGVGVAGLRTVSLFTATDEGQWLTSANTKWMSTVKVFYQTFLYVKEKRA